MKCGFISRLNYVTLDKPRKNGKGQHTINLTDNVTPWKPRPTRGGFTSHKIGFLSRALLHLTQYPLFELY